MKKIILFVIGVIFCALTLVCCGKTKAACTVVFRQDGADDIIRTVKKGEGLSKSEIPVPKSEDGYDLAWSVTDFSKVNEDIIVTVLKHGKPYFIDYVLNNGRWQNGVQGISVVSFGEEYFITPPEKENAKFLGWQYNGAIVPSSGIWSIHSDACLTAVWEENILVNVTFVQKNQTQVITHEKNTALQKSEIPAISAEDYLGYDVSWDYDLTELIKKDTTIEVKAVAKSYTITFDLGECKNNKYVSKIDGEMNVVYNEDYVLPTPVCCYYTFLGWKKNEQDTEYIASGKYLFAEDISLIAVWRSDKDEWSESV